MDNRGWTATHEQIAQTWRVVSGLYHDFNLDVMYGDDPGTRPDVARVLIGGTSPIPGAAGQSPIGVWHYGTLYRQYGDAFTGEVYSDTLGNDPTLTGVAVAHEAGHLFGEFHTPNGVMGPVLLGFIPDPAWPAEVNVNGVFQNTYGDLSADFGFAPVVPEPYLLLALPLLLLRRHHRQSQERPASGGTSTIPSIDTGTRERQRAFTFRAACSASFALMYLVSAYCRSAISCSYRASTLYLGIYRA